MEIIVEIGNSHDGSLGIATSFVEIVKSTGVKTVKFQMHLADFEGMPDEPFRVNFSNQDSTRYEYWKRVNFTFDEWKFLHNFVVKNNLEFMCTPFSLEAAQWLEQNQLIKKWKVGSGDAVNFPLLDFLIETNKPLLISTGLITWNEILLLKQRLITKNAWARTTLMHCVSEYPTPIENSSLNLIQEIKQLGCKVGLSDHSGNWLVPLKAVAMGIDVLEIHFKPHEKFFGPDASSSLTDAEIKTLVNAVEVWDTLSKNHSTKDSKFQIAENISRIFRKGIYWSNSKQAGEVVEFADLIFRKPVVGMDSKDFESIIGKSLKKSVSANQAVFKNDVA